MKRLKNNLLGEIKKAKMLRAEFYIWLKQFNSKYKHALKNWQNIRNNRSLAQEKF